MPRPHHSFRVTDELGQLQRLAPGHDVVSSSRSRDWLILGLGPDPKALAESLPPEARVRYVECPALWEQMDEDWHAAIPTDWQRIETFDPLAEENILFSGAGRRLFPGFWAPFLAALLLPCPAAHAASGPGTVLLGASTGSTLAPDVRQAFRDENLVVRSLERADLLDCLEQTRPVLALSLNFAGLDRSGEVQALLDRAGVPVAVWCLDNPFLVLAGVRNAAWRTLRLFVTDAWCVEPLARHGARQVQVLPLAAGRHFFEAAPDHPELAQSLLYVGRSAIPDKELVFSGLHLRPERVTEARAMLERGERPDFGWWAKRLGCDTFWPGRDARRVGLGAEALTRDWRVRVLRQAARSGRLAVCGDEAWRELLDEPFTALPCVDYWEGLPGRYASARYVLGAASLLLPHALSQRHFDVWAAGGCLLTDATPGLDLFPAELTRPITYRTAREIPELLRRPDQERTALIAAWRTHIAAAHTYRHRVRTILESLT
ncbi:MAG: glycosyltransferase [Desulfovibrionaceae bacterium]